MTAGSLRASGLGMQFEGLSALSDISMDVPAGEIRGLIGPNGAGKTTFFNCVTGFYRPTSGSLALDDQPLNGLEPHEISASGVSRTFQNIRLFNNMTVLENVLIGGHGHIGGNPSPPRASAHSGPRVLAAARRIPHVPRALAVGIRELGGAIGRPAAVRNAESVAVGNARDLLRAVGLAGKENAIARGLSYGDQRRLEMARALGTRPRLLLLDEPTAGMNPQESGSMVRLIRQIRDEFGATIILIEHQMRVVMGVCERITVLDYGRMIAEGTPEEIQRDPRVVEAYLGKGAAEEGRHGPA